MIKKSSKNNDGEDKNYEHYYYITSATLAATTINHHYDYYSFCYCCYYCYNNDYNYELSSPPTRWSCSSEAPQGHARPPVRKTDRRTRSSSSPASGKVRRGRLILFPETQLLISLMII